MGTVRGNLVATDRLEIRASGSIMGNVTTARLKVEDGSHFQGGIDICEPEPEPFHEPVEDAEPVEMQHSRYDYAEARY
jgi:cytoskeletal protein CcmA (bactofilin family)